MLLGPTRNLTQISFRTKVRIIKMGYLRCFALLIGLAVLFWPALVFLDRTKVVADEQWVSIISQNAKVNFPEEIRFSLEYTVAKQVSRVTLAFEIAGRDATRIEPADIKFGDPYAAEVVLRTRGGSSTFLPPGAVISYRWFIEDETGDVIRTDPIEFTYIDSRFVWETVSKDNMTVYYNGPVATRAQTVLDTSVETLSIMGDVLQVEISRPINIVMYNNQVQMKDALPFVSQTSSSGLVTQGQAYGDEGVLLINGFDRQIKGIVSHEVTHLLISKAGEGPSKRLPAWINEGLAEYGNIEPGSSYDLAVLYAIRNDILFPLVQLVSRPGRPDDTIVFYGHARQVVNFMIEKYGPQKIAELLREFKEGSQSFADTFENVYGFDLIALDNKWRESIGLPPVSEDRIRQRPSKSDKPTPIPTRMPLGASTSLAQTESSVIPSREAQVSSSMKVESDIEGLSVLTGAYGSVAGTQTFVAAADLNDDGIVNYLDLAILGSMFDGH